MNVCLFGFYSFLYHSFDYDDTLVSCTRAAMVSDKKMYEKQDGVLRFMSRLILYKIGLQGARLSTDGDISYYKRYEVGSIRERKFFSF